ncbi:hypothetical protein XAC3810_640011 [Xanthomonas citri pv. citri]|nr:hypothetical protein HZS93_03559 [Xanthomonas citri]CEE35083.1 hypothetical protein XAC9322_610011 [Xanthomonas citri pv. citri]CEE36123.1 hypothetical protein XAC1083_630011 [Xanthomonas citri pv. citri]CEE45312.1 hypothetical protein XAC3810_640011 [Xanthomonas citri pv. citri]CEE77962.1 hypothetical protein XAC2852_700058 [Xanthomonas citri pv. citri]
MSRLRFLTATQLRGLLIGSGEGQHAKSIQRDPAFWHSAALQPPDTIVCPRRNRSACLTLITLFPFLATAFPR